jgi:deoxyadenosine/deoxycytidine kinase
MAENRYIVVEGVIGVGKTSLSRLLSERLPARLVLEEVEENPFLKDFYVDRARFAFPTQMHFLFSRYQQQRDDDPKCQIAEIIHGRPLPRARRR